MQNTNSSLVYILLTIYFKLIPLGFRVSQKVFTTFFKD